MGDPREQDPVLTPVGQEQHRDRESYHHGVIEKSNASYYSHPVIVQKTEDKVRVCIDYRNLNDCIKPASWPLPNIRGLFERIGHNKPTVFGVMDLTAGYHQAPLYPPHRVFTAFLCFCGLYQFTRLPFGPKRAPSYLNGQMVTKVLQGLLYVSCKMYLDDCIVYASDEDQFLTRLREVFQRFRERYGLTLGSAVGLLGQGAGARGRQLVCWCYC